LLLMLGAAWGLPWRGNRLERFLAPGRSLDLLDRDGDTSQLTHSPWIAFAVERDPAGRPEQFRSLLSLSDSSEPEEISVNHPLRHRGITIYQADWSLAAISVQIGRSPVLQQPLQTYPELGEQVWGLVLPTRPDGSQPVFLSLDNEKGPVLVYDSDGQVVTRLRPGGPAKR
jgi:cytochrome c biogenesis protein